ncbi:unnamed protein product, partial [Iphiclides podalirius]
MSDIITYMTSGGAARVVFGARVRCTEQRESHKHKRSRRATDGRQAARRGELVRAHPSPLQPNSPSAVPSAPRRHPARRLAYHAARRAASFLLVQLRAFRHCHTSVRPVDCVLLTDAAAASGATGALWVEGVWEGCGRRRGRRRGAVKVRRETGLLSRDPSEDTIRGALRQTHTYLKREHAAFPPLPPPLLNPNRLRWSSERITNKFRSGCLHLP